MADDIIAGGLCDVMERALIDRGIAPDIARKLAEKACAPPDRDWETSAA